MFRSLAFIIFAGALGDRRTFSAGRSDVIRIFDDETGVVCYVVPKETCMVGDCGYSPAISCVKVK